MRPVASGARGLRWSSVGRVFGKAGQEPSLLGLGLPTEESGAAWIDHAGDLQLRVDEVRLDQQVGLALIAALQRQGQPADAAAECPPHLVGGDDEADRVGERRLGDGHPEQTCRSSRR